MAHRTPGELVDYRLVDVPGYMDWSKRELNEGESPDLIAHLDATGMCLRPTELNEVSEDIFDELLEDLKSELDECE